MEQAFSLSIDDPLMKNMEINEFSIVKNPSEWKFWVEKLGFEKPAEWNMISEENVFVLKPKVKYYFNIY